jgi:hypothetical protein
MVMIVPRHRVFRPGKANGGAAAEQAECRGFSVQKLMCN